jgi:hypothetical protein
MGTHGAPWTARSTESVARTGFPAWHPTCFLQLREGGLRLIVVTFRILACPVILLLLAGDVGLASQAWAQTTAPPTTSQAPPAAPLPPDLNLGRIRSGLEQPKTPTIFDDGRLRFFAETNEKAPSFESFTVGFNLRSGLVPGAGMTHQEFLNQVTPKNLYSSGGITALDQLQWGLVNYAAIWTVKRLYKELDEARTEWRRKQIQQQIDRELAALRGGK